MDEIPLNPLEIRSHSHRFWAVSYNNGRQYVPGKTGVYKVHAIIFSTLRKCVLESQALPRFVPMVEERCVQVSGLAVTQCSSVIDPLKS